MQVADPRERFEDVYTSESRERLDPAAFAEAVESEVATAGWVVIAFAFDEGGRVLLVEQPWADGWICPGGALKEGESLSEGVRRELREETGIAVDPVAPRGVDEFAFVNEESGETVGWTLVVFEALARGTDLATDPGLDDEEITDIRWFDGLPATVYNPDLFEPVFDRCENAS